MAPEAAETIRQALTGVVKKGTAKGLLGAYLDVNGTPNAGWRQDRHGRQPTKHLREWRLAGHLLPSRRPHGDIRLRSGDRLYGTVTAYVAGPQAARYKLHQRARRSRVLRVLEPALMPLFRTPRGNEARDRKERVLGTLP